MEQITAQRKLRPDEYATGIVMFNKNGTYDSISTQYGELPDGIQCVNHQWSYICPCCKKRRNVNSLWSTIKHLFCWPKR